MKNTLTALVIDDNKIDSLVLSRYLEKLAHYDVQYTTCQSSTQAVAEIESNDRDIVLIDYYLDDEVGTDVIDKLRLAGSSAAFILVTGLEGSRVAQAAIQAGASSYITKGELSPETLERCINDAVKQRNLEKQTLLQTAALNSAANTIVITDTKGVIVWVNKAFSELTGYSRSEVIGKPTSILKSGAVDKSFYQDLWGTISAGQAWHGELTNKRKDGSLYLEEMTITPVVNNRGEIQHYVAIKQNITERRANEVKLQESETRVRTIIDTAHECIISVNSDGKLTEFNPASEKAFNYCREDIIGKPIADLLIPAEHREKFLENFPRYAREGRGELLDILLELNAMKADGSTFPAELTITSDSDSAGGKTGFTVILRDITERKMQAHQLQQALKMEAIGQLSAGIAHEINTPTQYIGDNIRFLKDSIADLQTLMLKYDSLFASTDGPPIPTELLKDVNELKKKLDIDYLLEEIPQAIEQSLEGVARVSKIVGAMKLFSHPGQEEKTAADLNQLIESTITVCRNEWKYVAELQTEFDSELPLVDCFPGEFNQVVLNLIVNAAHAIADSPKDESKISGVITITTSFNKDWADIRITDNGSGIPEGITNRVFDPFFTTKDVGKGTGQGLSMAHDIIVNRHGGQISFETQAGIGTTFIIRLPLKRSPGQVVS